MITKTTMVPRQPPPPSFHAPTPARQPRSGPRTRTSPRDRHQSDGPVVPELALA
jgi:hypothetical protein